MNKFKMVVIEKVIAVIMGMLSEDQIKRFAQDVLIRIRSAVKDSDSKLDDQLALPLIDLIETAFNLEEREDEKKI